MEIFRSPETMVDGMTGDHELVSGMSSTLTQIMSEQDMNLPGNLIDWTVMDKLYRAIYVFSIYKRFLD